MFKQTMRAFAAIVFAVSAAAQAETYVEGTHYTVLDNPVRTFKPNTVEVAEVFWYGCGHCYNFEPVFNEWKKSLPEDVNVVLVPAIFGGLHKAHAKLYYIAKQLKVEDKARLAIYKEILAKRGRGLADVDSQAEFMANYGIDEAKYRKMFNSFSINSMVNIAESKGRGYQVTGTPDVIVQGKYRIDNFKSREEQLAIAKFLVEKEIAAQ